MRIFYTPRGVINDCGCLIERTTIERTTISLEFNLSIAGLIQRSMSSHSLHFLYKSVGSVERTRHYLKIASSEMC